MYHLDKQSADGDVRWRVRVTRCHVVLMAFSSIFQDKLSRLYFRLSFLYRLTGIILQL